MNETRAQPEELRSAQILPSCISIRPRAIADGAQGRFGFIYVLGEELDRWTHGAIRQDAKLGGGELSSWEKVAVVSDKDWLGHTLRGFGWIMPGDVRAFARYVLEEAKAGA